MSRFRTALRYAPYFLLPLVAFASLPFDAGDLAAWTAIGAKSLAGWGRGGPFLLEADPFSVLPTSPFVYPAWFPSLLYGAFYPVLGLSGLALAHAAILLAALAWVYRRTIFRAPFADSRLARASVYALWIGALPAFGERPSALAILPLLLAYDQVSRVRGRVGARRLAKLAAIQAAWANLHGSFVLGIAMLAWRQGILFARRPGAARARSFALGLAATLAASLANPFGARVFGYVLETARISRERGLTEWAPTLPGTEFPHGLASYALAAGAAILLSRRFRRDRGRALASPFALLVLNGFTAIRNTAAPFLFFPVFLATYFRPALARSRARVGDPEAKEPRITARASALFPLVLLAAWIALLPSLKPKLAPLLPPARRAVFASDTPLFLLRKMGEVGIDCPVFAEIEIGGALMLYNYKIFMDTRNVIYADADFRAVENALAGEAGALAFIRQKNACAALVDRVRHPGLADALKGSPEWRFLAQEQGVELYILK